MQKMYALNWQDDDFSVILGVFSRRQLAEQEATMLRKTDEDYKNGSFHVKEFTVDKLFDSRDAGYSLLWPEINV